MRERAFYFYIWRENVQVEAVFAEIGLRKAWNVLSNERFARIVLVARVLEVRGIVQWHVSHLGLSWQLLILNEHVFM